jgi:hypothetical protein
MAFRKAEGTSSWGMCPHSGIAAMVALGMSEVSLTDWTVGTIWSSKPVITRVGTLTLLKLRSKPRGWAARVNCQNCPSKSLYKRVIKVVIKDCIAKKRAFRSLLP